MAVLVVAMPLTGLVDLINGWGSTPRREAGEQSWPYPALHRLDGRLGVPPGVEPEADGPLIEIADSLHPIFAGSDAAERAERLNQLITSTGVRPTVHVQGERMHSGWNVDKPQHALMAAATMALCAQLAEHDPNRLGTCAGRRCADVYIDASPDGHRRFCSITCQTRARVSAFRARRAAT